MPDKKSRSNSIAPNAKGDLVIGTGSAASGVLAVGSTDQVLTVDSTTTTGVKWATPGGALSLAQLASATWPTGTTKLQITGLANKDYLVLQIENGTINTAGGYSMSLRINDDSGATKYAFARWRTSQSGTPSITSTTSTGTSSITFASPISTSGNVYAFITISNNKSTGFKDVNFNAYYSNSSGQNEGAVGQGIYLGTAQTSSIEIISGVNFNGSGSYTLWGA